MPNSTRNDRKETGRKRWPWFALLLIGVITFAPGGVAKAAGLAKVYNKSPGVFIAIFWLFFTGLWMADFNSAFNKVRPVAFIIGLILIIVNLGGCVAALGELGTIH